MPVTNTRTAQCGTKTRFETRADAARARDWKVEKGAAAGSIGAYRCRHCSGFHIGHRRPDASEGRRGRKQGR